MQRDVSLSVLVLMVRERCTILIVRKLQIRKSAKHVDVGNVELGFCYE
tara:strand:- start:435 stop:578 length:144 start_codon:yes stop_codon:yes gene_type:complete